jgi:hypothetical protein
MGPCICAWLAPGHDNDHPREAGLRQGSAIGHNKDMEQSRTATLLLGMITRVATGMYVYLSYKVRHAANREQHCTGGWAALEPNPSSNPQGPGCDDQGSPRLSPGGSMVTQFGQGRCG